MVHLLSTFLTVLICSDIFIWNLGIAAESYENFSSAISTHCSADNFTIFLFVRLFANLNQASFHLNNKTCKQKQLNGTHIIFKFKINECGTINQTYKGSTIYINFLHGYVKERNNNYSKNFTKLLHTVTTKCEPFDNVTRNASDSVRQQDDQNFGNNTNFVDSEEKKKLEKPKMQPLIELNIKPSHKWQIQTTAKLSAEGKGHTSGNRDLATPMPQALMENEGFIKFTSEGRNMVKVGDKVIFQAQLTAKNQERSFLAVHDCHVSEDEDKGSTNTESFIKNGCETKPSLCNYVFKHGSTSQKFSFKITSSDFQRAKTLSVHCTFALCRKNDPRSLCATGCRGTRKDIKVNGDNLILLSAGPLTITEESKAGPGILVTLPAAMLIMFAAVSLSIFHYKRRCCKPKRRVTLLENEGLSEWDRSHCYAVLEESREMFESLHEKDYRTILQGKKSFLNMDWSTV